jgi:subtilase family serine protease
MRSPWKISLNVIVLVALLAWLSSSAKTQSSRPQPRITEAINSQKLMKLAGNTRPEANQINDRGAVPDSFKMEHMLLQLRRSPQQEQELERYIDRLQDPNSANFHHWLTPEQFGESYGLAPEDLSTITGWLKSEGFEVNIVYPDGVLIDFSGTAGQVRAAFHTEMHYLEVAGKQHVANMSDPQIPSALASVVAGIVSLHNFRPHPGYTSAGPCVLSGTCYSVVPADLATIYNLNPLFTKGISGQGQTIVVIEDTDVFNTGDWNTFRTAFGLNKFSSGSFTQVHPQYNGINNCGDPGVDPNGVGADSEAILDAEWSSAAAPSAAIHLASCSDATLDNGLTPTFGGLIAVQNIINSAAPPAIISISYGECEAFNGQSANAAYNSAYQQAVAEGVSVFVSSGDEGAASCDADQPYAIFGVAVSAFASTPYNVAVGGTDFGDTSAGSNSTYWNSSNTSTYGSALSYIPEIPWNSSCASSLIAEFEGYKTGYGLNGLCNASSGEFVNTASGSGGPSGCATGSSSVIGVVSGTCAGYAKPSWQSVTGNPKDGVRDLPDVSLFAANGAWGHDYVYCDSNVGNGGAACIGAPSGWSGAGGTSFATPIMAGIQSLVNQNTGSRWGNPNPTYYALAATEYGSSGSANCNSSKGNSVASSCVFYDITEGDMDVPCQINPFTLKGTLFNCYAPQGTFGVLSLSNSSYKPAYGTQTGWDFATGLGSVNATNLVNNWLSSVPFQLNAISPDSVAVGAGATSISVGGSGFSSQSQVQFAANGTHTALATTFISQSQLSASIPASLLQTAGTAQVSVSDPTRQSPSSAVTFTVTLAPPVISALAPASAVAGGAAFTLTVTGSNFTSGAVLNFDGMAQATTFVSATSLTAAIPAASIAAAGTNSITIMNPSPLGGTSSALSFTVDNPLPVLNSISPTNIAMGSTEFTLTVNGSNFNSSSIVNFNGQPVATAFVSAKMLTAAIPAANVATAGIDPVTVSNPAPAGGTSAATSFSVLTPDFVLNVNGSGSASVVAGQTAVYKNAISFTPQNDFSSSVALSCTSTAPLSQCSASPSSLTQGGSATISVSTAAHSALPPDAIGWRMLPSARVPLTVLASCALIVAILLFSFVGQKHRRILALYLPLAVVFAALILQSSCSSNGATGSSAGTYTVTVMGSNGSTVHTATLTLNVR